MMTPNASLASAIERLERSTWDNRVLPIRNDIRALLDHCIALRALADEAVSMVEDAVRETNWGTPTFGPDYGEELRAGYDAICPKELAGPDDGSAF